jgi:hypothetical protein
MIFYIVFQHYIRFFIYLIIFALLYMGMDQITYHLSNVIPLNNAFTNINFKKYKL